MYRRPMRARPALTVGAPALLSPWLALGVLVPVFVDETRGDAYATQLVDPRTGAAEPGPPRTEPPYEPDCATARPGEELAWQVRVANSPDGCIACVNPNGLGCGALRLYAGGAARALGDAPGTERPQAATRAAGGWWLVTGSSTATLLGWPDAGAPARLALDPSWSGASSRIGAPDGFFHVQHDWEARGERAYHVGLDGAVTDLGLLRHAGGSSGGAWCGRPAPDGRVVLFGTRHRVPGVAEAPFVGLAGAAVAAVTALVGVVRAPGTVGCLLAGAVLGCETAPLAVVVFFVATFDPGKMLM